MLAAILLQREMRSLCPPPRLSRSFGLTIPVPGRYGMSFFFDCAVTHSDQKQRLCSDRISTRPAETAPLSRLPSLFVLNFLFLVSLSFLSLILLLGHHSEVSFCVEGRKLSGKARGAHRSPRKKNYNIAFRIDNEKSNLRQ